MGDYIAPPQQPSFTGATDESLSTLTKSQNAGDEGIPLGGGIGGISIDGMTPPSVDSPVASSHGSETYRTPTSSTPTGTEQYVHVGVVVEHPGSTCAEESPNIEQPHSSMARINRGADFSRRALIIIATMVAFTAGALGAFVGLRIGGHRNKNDDDDDPSSPTAAPSLDLTSSTLSRILQRGSLIVAVSTQDGYFKVDSETNEPEGFEMDLARALAAGMFGTGSAVTPIDVPFGERFTALNASDVDVVIASATVTMQRDVFEPSTGTGFTFSTPYLYNGLRFGGVPEFVSCADQLNFNGTCAGVKVCVLSGTTHVDRVTQLSDGADVNVPGALDLESFYEYFIDGICNVLAGEETEVSEAAVRRAGYQGEYLVGTNVFSKEPLAIVTRDDDPYFSDFVNWILQSLLAAEEKGITKALARSFPKSNVFGPDFENMFVNAIAAVGNYGEIYARHLQAVVPRKPINTINKGDSGLIYSLPFGTINGTGPGPIAGGTLEEIIRRGFLRCAVPRRGFAEFNYTTQTWAGFDVDYCRALSAAIFSGDSTRVLFRNQPATERFKALASGDVDVLSRITTVNLIRDVLEPTAMVGFSFSQPNFYEGLSFGGIPPYVQCADSLDTNSQECKDIKICVSKGTTDIENLRQKFLEKYIVAKDSGELALQGLANGDCQVVAGGSVHDISRQSVEGVGGYRGPYMIGVKRHSKDPLALVTRQDDPQWTSFVHWVVSATFYAEEQGITQNTSSQMPITNLFGVVNNHMLRDIIRAVGSYNEIYERNVAILVRRGGLNLPNANPYGPQHYAMPGF